MKREVAALQIDDVEEFLNKYLKKAECDALNEYWDAIIKY